VSERVVGALMAAVLLAAAGVLGIVLRPPATNQSPISQGEEAAMPSDPRAADTDLLSARELALRMGGALELESRPSRTVFTLRLAAFSRENEPLATVR